MKKDEADQPKFMLWLDIADTGSGMVLQCEAEVNNFIRAVTERLNLISVMGPTRSGKSTLMNLLAGCKEQELFPTSPGGDTFTKGKTMSSAVV